MLDEKAVQDFFFRAALATYAGNSAVEDGVDLGLPGHKVLTLTEGIYRYRDAYASTPKGRADGVRHSRGFTWIWADDQPVWYMTYHGWWNSNDGIKYIFVGLF